MPEKTKRWRAAVWAAAFLIAVWAVVVIIKNVQENSSPVPKKPLSTTSGVADDLRLDAWVDDSRLVAGDQVHYRITATNRSKTSSVWGLRIAVTHPGLADFVAITNTPADLAPGRTTTFNGTFKALHDAGKYGIGALATWKEGDVDRSKPISIGPITIEDPERRAWLLALKTLQGIIKDIAIPIAAGVIVWYLGKLDEKRKEANENLENKRVRLHQTWTLMLPKVHEYAEKYYLPACVDASSVAKYYSGPHQNQDTCFYFYLLFIAQMKRMIDKISGFYLRYRIGEDTVGVLWETLLDRADGRYTRLVREQAQLIVNPLWTLYEFDKKTRMNGVIQGIKTKFIAPAEYATFAADVPLLTLFAIVLAYETNSGYEFWYEPEKLPDKAWKDAFDEFVVQQPQFPPAKFNELKSALEEHHKNAAGRA